MSFRGHQFTLPIHTDMTTSALATTSVLAEFTGGAQSDIAMMIGVGIVKDSDAVFFQYLGDNQQPQALTLPTNGKPLTRLSNVKLAGIEVVDNIGEFNSTKLNLILESSAGNRVLLTSGLTTIWSQCVVNALMAVFGEYGLQDGFTLDSWKGTSKMRPCFAAIRVGSVKVRDEDMYNQLADARGDRDYKRVEQIMRDAVNILNHAVTGGAVEPVVVAVESNEQLTDHPDF